MQNTAETNIETKRPKHQKWSFCWRNEFCTFHFGSFRPFVLALPHHMGCGDMSRCEWWTNIFGDYFCQEKRISNFYSFSWINAVHSLGTAIKRHTNTYTKWAHVEPIASYSLLMNATEEKGRNSTFHRVLRSTMLCVPIKNSTYFTGVPFVSRRHNLIKFPVSDKHSSICWLPSASSRFNTILRSSVDFNEFASLFFLSRASFCRVISLAP